jgi:hypothetical protein
VAYKGELFVSTEQDLKYGITKIIPIEVVEKFIKKNAGLLNSNGINLKNIFYE